MKIRDIITEGLSYPVICVDVQPAYDNPVNQKIINFVTKQTGPVLFFVNAPGALSPKLYSSVFGVCLGLVSRLRFSFQT